MTTLQPTVQPTVQPTLHLAQHLTGPPEVLVDRVAMFTLNPLEWLGGQAKEALADGFTSMMMSIWSGAMWLLKAAFGLIDSFTPSVADPGLGRLYSVTVWVALVIALVMAFSQIGLAVIRQDGRGFGTLAAGVVQYGVVLACWVSVSAGFIAAASGLTRGILDTLLGVDSFSGYAAGAGFVDQVTGTTQAATLGICALFVLIPAAFGHMVIMMVRSAALLILVATMPMAAAGALSEGTKLWMWKSIRWFIACVLMEPLLALVVGLGTQFAWAGMPDGAPHPTSRPVVPDGPLHVASTSENIGMSVVGSIILLVSCFMPLVLFRMLAFVDPGTASGASFRSTMNANGGVAGLLKGTRSGTQPAGSGAANATGTDGRTSSEAGAEAETANRWQAKTAKALPALGGVIGGALEKTGKVAQTGAAMSLDVLGQAGIGNQGYYSTETTDRTSRSRTGQGHQHTARPGETASHTDATSGGEASSERRTPTSGAANELPPAAQVAVEDGAFLG